MRKSLKALGLITMVIGLGLGFAPGAEAHPPDGRPTPPVPTAPKAACTVIGSVTAPRTPTGTVGHSSYTFVTTTINCVYNDGRVVNYDVTANGGSWGPGHAGLCESNGGAPGACDGSSTLASYSDNSHGQYTNPCGDSDVANKGNISATDGTGTAQGWVKFLRGASETVAWGSFCAGSGQGVGDTFTANLEFTPANPADTTSNPVTYDLRGVATIND